MRYRYPLGRLPQQSLGRLLGRHLSFSTALGVGAILEMAPLLLASLSAPPACLPPMLVSSGSGGLCSHLRRFRGCARPRNCWRRARDSPASHRVTTTSLYHRQHCRSSLGLAIQTERSSQVSPPSFLQPRPPLLLGSRQSREPIAHACPVRQAPLPGTYVFLSCPEAVGAQASGCRRRRHFSNDMQVKH